MKERVIKIENELVPVSEEVYKAYYKSIREDRKIMHDRKYGRPIDDEGTRYTEPLETSIEQLAAAGMDISTINKNANEKSIVEIAIEKETIKLLNKALEILQEGEKKLINDIYIQEKTVRTIGKEYGISHVSVGKRHKKVLKKLRKELEKYFF